MLPDNNGTDYSNACSKRIILKGEEKNPTTFYSTVKLIKPEGNTKIKNSFKKNINAKLLSEMFSM